MKMKTNKKLIMFSVLLILSVLIGFKLTSFSAPIKGFGEFIGLIAVCSFPSIIVGGLTLFINEKKIPIVICAVQFLVCLFLTILIRPYL